MYFGYLISIIRNDKIGPQFYFTLNVKSLYNRLQCLRHELPTDKKGGQTLTHTQFVGLGKNIMLYEL